MVLKADKGNATIVMERVDYEEKCVTMLSGKTYSKLDINLTQENCWSTSQEDRQRIG